MGKNTSKDDFSRFSNIGYEDFRDMAKDESLSRYEKVGFPDAYRAGKEKLIFDDMCSKLPALERKESFILDIGSGCSDLPRFLIERATQKSQRLVLIDSAEMLDQLPVNPNVRKIPARYPDCPEFLEEYRGKFDAIITYSVIQYVFAEGNIFDFLDKSLQLLAPGGGMLIGDIPNLSMRKRFFASENGVAHHRQFTGSDETPLVTFNCLESRNIDDSVVLALISRARAAGFHSFILPQASNLPMANRREDLLLVRP